MRKGIICFCLIIYLISPVLCPSFPCCPILLIIPIDFFFSHTSILPGHHVILHPCRHTYDLHCPSHSLARTATKTNQERDVFNDFFWTQQEVNRGRNTERYVRIRTTKESSGGDQEGRATNLTKAGRS
ncbi:MAG: hypothetical protein JOS17DRAFT_314372 [Linnemannia elongata]|nr:MAG: hypothetical protein JOS17DRAFT_314372 [Linnemannia elongata]